MDSYAYYNGKFEKKNNLSIPLSDRSIFFGDAIYDAAIGRYDRILWEDEHIDRFLSNAKRIGIEHHLDKKYLSDLLREVAVKSMIESYFLYFQLSRDLTERCHCADGCGANLLITVDPFEINNDPTPLKLITAEDLRYGYCDIKTVNLLPSVLSMTEAKKHGCDEAVFIRKGIVTECSKSNISILKQGRLITHPKTNRILPGIAREHLLAICKEIGIACEEREFSKEDLFSADEILVSSTTKLCNRVSNINSLPVGSKDKNLAQKIIKSMHKEYANFCIR